MGDMLKTLTRRSFAANRLRSLITALAIALVAMLFTSVTTIAMGSAESVKRIMQIQKMSISDGDFRYMDKEQFEAMRQSDLIEKAGLRMPVGYLTNTLRHNVEFNVVAAHLFWLQINLIDCHRINRYNDISIEKEKVPEHLFFCRDKCSGTIYKDGYYIKIRNRIQ